MPGRLLTNLKELLRVTGDAPVVLSFNKDKVFVGSHTDYHSVILESPFTYGENHEIVIDGKSAQQIVRSITPERFKVVVDNGVTFSSKGVKLVFPALESKLTVATLAAKFDKTETHLVDGAEFAAAVKRIKHAANDTSIGDVVLRGYHLTTKKDALEFMSSNGAVLAVTEIPALVSGTEGIALLNPEFHQIAALFSSSLSIRQSKDTISFESTATDERVIRAVSNLTYGEGVPYASVVEQVSKNPIAVEVNAKMFVEALKASVFFTDETANKRITLTLKPDDIEIHASNDNGKSLTTVEPDNTTGLKDDGISIITGYSNLFGFLSNSNSPVVTIKVKDSMSPIYVDTGNVKGVSVLFFK